MDIFNPLENDGWEDRLIIEPPKSVDKSLFLNIPNSRFPQRVSRFKENLVKYLEPSVLQEIGVTLNDAIESDYEGKAQRDQMIADTLKYINLKQENRDNIFKGASGVKSAMLMKVLTKGLANASSQIFPAQGPVQGKITVDKSNEILREIADKKANFYNFYFTDFRKDFYPDKDQLLLWTQIAGDGYSKIYIDPIEGLPVARNIDPRNIILNLGCKNIEDAERITIIVTLNKRQFIDLFESGLYCDPNGSFEGDILDAGGDAGTSDNPIEEQVEQITGVTKSSDFEDQKEYKIRECYTYLKFKGDSYNKEERYCPYIAHQEEETQKIVGLYRNWRERDPKRKTKKFLVKYTFIPSPDQAYGIGLAQIALGNTEASTSINRSLIDSGYFANAQGGVKLKSLKATQNDIRIGPGEWHDIDPIDGYKINEMFLALPSKEPCQALIQFKNDLEKDISDIVGANQFSAEDIQNAQTGTTLAILDQLSRNESAFIKKLHRSFGEELLIFEELFREILEERGGQVRLGNTDHVITLNDFMSNISIVPVSDPNITSSTQKIIQATTLLDIYKQDQDKFDAKEVYKYTLTSMFPHVDVDSFFVKSKEPITSDALEENKEFLGGESIRATLMQDHDAHCLVHQALYDNIMEMIKNGIQVPPPMGLLAHIFEHQHLKFIKQSLIQGGINLDNSPIEKIQKAIDEKKVPIEIQNQVSQNASATILERQQEQKNQEAQQPIPLDPVRIEAELGQKELQLQAEKDMHQQLIDKIKMQQNEFKLNMEQQKLERQYELQKEKQGLEIQKAAQQHDIALTKADIEKAKIQQAVEPPTYIDV